MNLLNKYNNICIFILILEVKRALGQSCIQSQQSTCNKTDTTYYVPPSNLNLNEDKTRFEGETGIDFLLELESNLDHQLYFGTTSTSKSRRNEIPIWTLVQKFIRDIKGVPEIPTDNGENNGSERKPSKNYDWAYEPFHLLELIKIEIKWHGILKHFYLEKEQFPALGSYLNDIEESTLQTRTTTENNSTTKGHKDHTDEEEHLYYIASHPLAVYQLIRRFALDLQPILFRLKSYKELTIMHGYANPFSLELPKMKDLKDALESIARIQVENMLDTYQLAKGKLENKETNIKLNALQALEVGTYYLDRGIYDLALEWIHFALETVKHSKLSKNFPWITVFFEHVYETAVVQHNNNFETKSNDPWFQHLFTSVVEPSNKPSAYTKILEIYKTKALQKRQETEWNWPILTNFRRLCSGENLQSEVEKSTLKCWYEKSSNPYWRINPLKMELLSDKLRVIQVYEFMGNNLINEIQQLALPLLRRSMVVNSSDAIENIVDSGRTSSHAWINEHESSTKFLLSFSRKLELLSGLSIVPSTSSHLYQVALYGPSHHYDVHLDPFVDSQRGAENGNRIATVLGYLNDVQVGGRTGFPVLGFAVTPVKGSIVMWYSLKRNGKDIDKRSYHGGCPVILGTKWVTNKWALYNDNFRNFQCTLKSDD